MANRSIHGIGQFILEVMTSFLEHVRACFPNGCSEISVVHAMHGNGASLMVPVDTDNAGAGLTGTQATLFSVWSPHAYSHAL